MNHKGGVLMRVYVCLHGTDWAGYENLLYHVRSQRRPHSQGAVTAGSSEHKHDERKLAFHTIQ